MPPEAHQRVGRLPACGMSTFFASATAISMSVQPTTCVAASPHTKKARCCPPNSFGPYRSNRTSPWKTKRMRDISSDISSPVLAKLLPRSDFYPASKTET